MNDFTNGAPYKRAWFTHTQHRRLPFELKTLCCWLAMYAVLNLNVGVHRSGTDSTDEGRGEREVIII